MKGALLLNVVVGESAAVLELLPRKDQALLVRRDALLVLDLALHHVDGVRRLYLESDGLARQCLYENLHLRGFLGIVGLVAGVLWGEDTCPSLQLLTVTFSKGQNNLIPNRH